MTSLPIQGCHLTRSCKSRTRERASSSKQKHTHTQSINQLINAPKFILLQNVLPFQEQNQSESLNVVPFLPPNS